MTVGLLRRLVLLWPERRELIERAQHIAQNLARDMRIARRRIQLGMSQSHLDHANIDALLQKVGGERVPRRGGARLRHDVCGDTRFSIPIASAVSRTTR